MHTAEPLVPEPSPCKIETVIEKLGNAYKILIRKPEEPLGRPRY
jgi:hypothetical protein